MVPSVWALERYTPTRQPSLALGDFKKKIQRLTALFEEDVVGSLGRDGSTGRLKSPADTKGSTNFATSMARSYQFRSAVPSPLLTFGFIVHLFIRQPKDWQLPNLILVS